VAAARNTAARWLPAALVVAWAGAWANSLAGDFVFDDRVWILGSREIRGGAGFVDLLRDTSRPVLKLSLAANFAVGGLDPRGYHAVNALIHLLAGLALFALVRRTLATSPRCAALARAAPQLAAASALLWLVHPLQTQAVTYVVQRGESLMGLLCLLTLACASRAASGRSPLAWSAAAALACAVGMGTKEVMLVAPLLVLLYDRTFFAGSFAAALRARPALHAGVAAAWIVPFGLIGPETLFRGEFARPDLPRPDALAYALSQPGVVLHYLRLALWPAPLCFDHGWPPVASAREALPALLAIAAALAATAWLVWRNAPAGFALAWFFLLLAPTSSVFPIADLAVEHRMYLPLAAVCVLAVTLGWRGLRALGVRSAWPGAALVLVLAAALAGATLRRNRDYHDRLVLWQTVQACAPDNPRGHYNAGTILRGRGRTEEAIAAYRRSLELDPAEPKAHYNLANALRQAGDAEAALAHYESALELAPDHAMARMNLANALQELGRAGEAIPLYEQLLPRRPEDARLHHNLGLALLSAGRADEAVLRLERSLALRPDSAATRRHLGDALRAQGRRDAALRHYRGAVALDPTSASAHRALADALAESGAAQEAELHYRLVLALDPDDARARSGLAALGAPPAGPGQGR
jgi:tetratricopeptide (TPR) repeat protein